MSKLLLRHRNYHLGVEIIARTKIVAMQNIKFMSDYEKY